MERFFDILFSTLGLLFFLPLLLIIILVLKFSGEREVFFFQKRIGKNGKEFSLLKFATMLKDSPNLGTGTVTVKNDPRILPIGKFLRKTKINELPQLANVICGDMSLVGPRPQTLQNFNLYPIKTQQIIKKVRPGLSGIGSIIFRSEEDIMFDTSTSLDFYEKVIQPYKGSLEEWFAVNKGLYTYFITIFITFWVILAPRTKIQWVLFKKLPEPPVELKKVLKYPN